MYLVYKDSRGFTRFRALGSDEVSSLLDRGSLIFAEISRMAESLASSQHE